MIHPIVLYNARILKDKSQTIDLKTANPAEVREMIDDMFETMHRASGIGLSSIQIGVPARAFVIEAHHKDGPPDEQFDLRETFINPVILEENNETVFLTEGCLSLPNIAALIERPKSIKIQYYNYDLKKIVKDYDGLAARIILHEFDHLNGVLFTDKLETMWKMMLEEPLRKIAEKEVRPDYQHK